MYRKNHEGRYSLTDWYDHNKCQYYNTDRQNKIAERLIAEGERIRVEAKDILENNKSETEERLKQRAFDIQFRRDEIETERKKIYLEIEALETYKERIKDAISATRGRGLLLSEQCIVIREKRQGIDLVHDNVEKQLLKEVEITKGVISILHRVLEQVIEQLRELRSVQFYLDKDKEDKQAVLNIENINLGLKETSSNIQIYEGDKNLDVAHITFQEWVKHTTDTMDRGKKQRITTTKLKSYVDLLLKKTVEDLWFQYNATNDAFRHRIEEIRQAKEKLELRHNETTKQVNEMTYSISELEKAINDKEVYIALTQTRLGNRMDRPRVELVRDEVERKLVKELLDLRANVAQLQHILAESQTSHRLLMKTQVQIQEDLNNKINSLKLDEVDCMTLRQNITYHAY